MVTYNEWSSVANFTVNQLNFFPLNSIPSFFLKFLRVIIRRVKKAIEAPSTVSFMHSLICCGIRKVTAIVPSWQGQDKLKRGEIGRPFAVLAIDWLFTRRTQWASETVTPGNWFLAGALFVSYLDVLGLIWLSPTMPALRNIGLPTVTSPSLP